MTTEFAVLEGRIRQALLDVRHIVERAEALLAKACLSHDDDYMDGIALNLHSFYAGIEDMNWTLRSQRTHGYANIS